MKKIILSFVAMATITLSALGQAPEGFKYQAVVRDAGNVILNNQAVGMRMTIKQGSIGGPTIYSETFASTTNAYGLVNLEIGNGTATSGTFASINWANGPFFIETAVDLTGGTNYVVMGTSQLMSVPYALYAQTSGSSTPGPQGPAGTNGAAGPMGPQGQAGLNGADGNDGLDGATGPMGPQGPAGTNGTDGNDGLDGATGPMGPQGPAGNDGLDGVTGPMGPQGPAGINGTDGNDGLDGATGPMGPQGPAGNDGLDGATGPMGPQGPAGLNGTDGNDGLDGATGPMGPQGPAGTNGLDGAIGAQGPIGATGLSAPTFDNILVAYGTASIATTTTWQNIPGLTLTVTIPAGMTAKVLVHAESGMFTNCATNGAVSGTDIAIYRNGVLLPNGGFRRVYLGDALIDLDENNLYGNPSFEAIEVLTAGTYTYDLRCWQQLTGSCNASVSGASGDIRQGMLSAQIILQ